MCMLQTWALGWLGFYCLLGKRKWEAYWKTVCFNFLNYKMETIWPSRSSCKGSGKEASITLFTSPLWLVAVYRGQAQQDEQDIRCWLLLVLNQTMLCLEQKLSYLISPTWNSHNQDCSLLAQCPSCALPVPFLCLSCALFVAMWEHRSTCIFQQEAADPFQRNRVGRWVLAIIEESESNRRSL